MKDKQGREVRYHPVCCCGDCPWMKFDCSKELFVCTRNDDYPEVNPTGEPPDDVCDLLTDSDILSFISRYESDGGR